MSTSSPLRVAVIGLGQMGAVHAAIVHEHPQAELVAVADLDAERLQRLADETGATPYRDFRTLFDEAEIDALSICLPDELHLEPVVAAAERGLHVLVEKPLATDMVQARTMIDACEANDVLLMVAHLLRFDPRYEAVKQAIEAGDLGDVTHVMAHRNSPWSEGPARYADGTSLTLHVAVHDIDLVTWFLADTPATVYAAAVSRKLADKGMHDHVAAIVRYRGGALATFQYSWALPPTSVTKLDARTELIGTRGMATVGTYHGQGVFIASDEHQDAPDVHHGPRVAGRAKGDVREEIGAFLKAVIDGAPSPVPPADALVAVQLAAAIEHSIATGDEVRFDAFVASAQERR